MDMDKFYNEMSEHNKQSKYHEPLSTKKSDFEPKPFVHMFKWAFIATLIPTLMINTYGTFFTMAYGGSMLAFFHPLVIVQAMFFTTLPIMVVSIILGEILTSITSSDTALSNRRMKYAMTLIILILMIPAVIIAMSLSMEISYLFLLVGIPVGSLAFGAYQYLSQLYTWQTMNLVDKKPKRKSKK